MVGRNGHYVKCCFASKKKKQKQNTSTSNKVTNLMFEVAFIHHVFSGNLLPKHVLNFDIWI